jgi:hypothetical protein
LNPLHNYETEVIKCGVININYLENGTKRQQLDPMLTTYNLIGTVHFPTSITNGFISTIGITFIDKTRNYTVSPFMNGSSDHDA